MLRIRIGDRPRCSHIIEAAAVGSNRWTGKLRETLRLVLILVVAGCERYRVLRASFLFLHLLQDRIIFFLERLAPRLHVLLIEDSVVFDLPDKMTIIALARWLLLVGSL